jgi:F-type H+-transporting ATPase subunit b
MLDINPGLILWTILTFLVVLVILRFTAWKTLLASLTAREDSIRQALEQTESARQESLRLLEEQKRQRLAAEEQSQQIVKEGRDLAEQLKAEILEKAQGSARHMIDQAKEEIGREKEQALLQLRDEVAELAVVAAGKILDANLDPAKHRKLVDSAIRSLNKG